MVGPTKAGHLLEYLQASTMLAPVAAIRATETLKIALMQQ
jgi:hypothetical protein